MCLPLHHAPIWWETGGEEDNNRSPTIYVERSMLESVIFISIFLCYAERYCPDRTWSCSYKVFCWLYCLYNFCDFFFFTLKFYYYPHISSPCCYSYITSILSKALTILSNCRAIQSTISSFVPQLFSARPDSNKKA